MKIKKKLRLSSQVKNIRENLFFYKTIAENAYDCIYWIASDGKFLYISPSCNQITGYMPDEFKTDSEFYEKIIHPDDRQAMHTHLYAGLENTEPCKTEFRIITKSGEIRWIRHECRPVYDDKHNFLGRSGSNRDITKQRTAEQSLKNINELLMEERKLFISGPVVLFKWKNEPGWPVEYVSPNVQEVFGYSAEEFVQQRVTYAEIIYKEDFEKVAAEIGQERANAPNHFNHQPYRIKRKDGELVWLYNFTTIIRNRNNEITHYLGYAIDITDRIKAEQALIESEERLRTLINATPDIICLQDGENRWLEANDAILKIFQLENVDYRGKKGGELAVHAPFFKDVFKVCESINKSVWEKRALVRKEVIIPCPNGEKKVFDVIKAPLFDEAGDRKCLISFCRDITEHKRMEAEWLKFSVSAEQSSASIVITNSKGDIEYVNPFFEQLTGYSFDEVKGKNPRILKSGKMSVEEYERLWETILKGETWKGIFINRKKNSELFWEDAIINPIKDSYGNITHFLAIKADITEKIYAEKALKKSEEKYRALFEESKDVIFISTPEGRFIDINPAGVQLFGYDSKDELLKINIARDLFCCPKERQEYVKKLQEKGFLKDYEIRLKKKDGAELIALETTTAVYDENKNIIMYRGIIHDVTENKLLESQLQQAQKMEAVGALAGGIAHDFNNLLTVINGYAELSLKESPKESLHPIYRRMSSILKAGKRAQRLTGQLLAFGRKQFYNPEIININNVILSTDKMLRRLVDEDIDIRINLNENLPFIKADPSQLEQILLNLIVNARDALRAVGVLPELEKKITIETGQKSLNADYIAEHPGSKSGLHVFFSVSDNGIGMDEQTRPRIFEPFFTTKGKYKGTGLGLSMVYGIVKQNNGSIYVYSEPGKGTMFKIYWPVTREKPVPVDNGKIDVIELTGNESILLVEDDTSVLQYTAEALTSLGYKVYAVSNGKKALAFIKSRKKNIELMITDIIMPKMGGVELAECVKANFPQIKIIFVSGYTDNHMFNNDILEKGVNFVHKPYSIQTLARKIREVLENG